MTEDEEFEFRLRLEREQAKAVDKPKPASGGIGDTARAGLRSMSPVLSSVLENPQGALKAGGQLVMGGLRGVKDMIDGGAELAARGFDAMAGTQEGNRVKTMNDAGKAEFAQNNPSPGAAIGRIGGNIITTLPVGPVLGAGVGMVSKAPQAVALSNALSSGGMLTGARPLVGPALMGKGADMALRMGAGATVGGTSAALISPEDFGMGATIGAAAPPVIMGLGKLGGAVAGAYGNAGAAKGKLLAKALDASDSEINAIIQAVKSAPDAIVPGSKLTLSQALQLQGQNTQNMRMLDRIATEGPGGKPLLQRYADQGEARMNQLVSNGAQKYQGAAATEAENTGNQLGAMLRTQAGDDKTREGAAWLATNARAVDEGAALQIPIDRMKALVADRMGDGYTGGTAATSKTLNEAERIGTEVFDAIAPISQASINKGQNLEQAVRAAGGLRGSSGELRDLGIRQSGTTGLINNKSGQSADLLAEKMYERGLLPDADPATLYEALRNGAGRKVYATDLSDAGFASQMEQAMGDMPGAERFTKAVPFKSFQTLRSGAGSEAAALSEKAGNEVQAGVMTQFEKLMAGRADAAAAGNLLPGESMSPGLMQDYNAARGLTRNWHEQYDGGNVISQILRKPAGQNYTLNGNEVTNKLWHGGSGLVDDVATLKRTLSDNNRDPAMSQLQRFIMTDAADKTTASGNFGSALPTYVESRLPGLQEALKPDQLNALTSVASDIRNAEAAAAIPGLRGSDSYAKISRAIDTGVFDSPAAKTLAKMLTFKGVGAEFARGKMSEMVTQSKAKTLAELLADPQAAAAALGNVRPTNSDLARALMQYSTPAARLAPILPAGGGQN